MRLMGDDAIALDACRPRNTAPLKGHVAGEVLAWNMSKTLETKWLEPKWLRTELAEYCIRSSNGV